MRSVRYQPIFNTLYFTLHCAWVLNNVVLSTALKWLIMDGRVGKRSVERVRYVINNLVIVKYGVISLLVCMYLPLARENTDATHERTRHISR